MTASVLLLAAVLVDPWSGRERHPAVVNPADRADDGTFLRLRGDWDFAKCHESVLAGRLVPGWAGGSWRVKVPGCWEASGIGDPGLPLTYHCQDNSPKPLRHVWNGTGVYRKTVRVPAAWTNGQNRIWLAAGGVAAQGWISVNDLWGGNDSPVGHYDSYCGTYKWEITDLLRGGDEVRVLVLADNTVPCRGGGLYSSMRFGGIYRDLELQVTPRVYVDDAWVRGDFDGRAAEVHVDLAGGSAEGLVLQVEIGDETVRRTVGRSNACTIAVPLRDFRPWSPAHPDLYTAKISLLDGDRVLMTRRERFGVRKLERRGKEFYLNGRPFFFRGFGDNHPYPVTGAPPADRAYHRTHLAKAKEAGFNHVRLHTRIEVPEFFEAADELGILVEPELPYYGNAGEDPFEFDPLRDAEERRDHYRRHPSYAIASGGNEASFAEPTARTLYRVLKETDPDRLVVEQDGCWPSANDSEGRSDYICGPLVVWKRGAFNQTPFICHEYLNLCVKTDSRDEAKYADTLWQPLLTRDERAAWLAKFGLDHEWGDRFQDAAHALQRQYQKMGLEWARMDPYCDGYCFWTIADTVVKNPKAGVFSAQGWLDPFWETKRGGWTPREFAAFNSPVAICLDLTDNPSSFPPDAWDPVAWWRAGGLRPRPSNGCIFEDTNRVFTAGAEIDARFILSYYAEEDLSRATLDWRFGTAAETWAEGRKDLGALTAGPARTVLETKLRVPAGIAQPVRARVTASVAGTENGWDVWVLPARTRRDGSRVFAAGRVRRALEGGFADLAADSARAEVVVGFADSAEVAAARRRGADTVEFDSVDTPQNVKLGWWSLGRQAGTAVKAHPALGDFPCGPVMDALFFRILKEGRALPVEGVGKDDLVIAGEGRDACYLHLSVTEAPTGARRIVVSGLDLLAPLPESARLLDNLVGYLLEKKKGRQ